MKTKSATNREIPFDAYMRGEFVEYVKLTKAADIRSERPSQQLA